MRPTIRAFIAIELTTRIKRELALTQERLKTAEADVAWSDMKNMHLTLKFLGDIHPEILDDVEEAIARTAVKYPPFHFDIGALGAFPNVEKPKTIWAGITKRANFLAEMAATLDHELVGLGIKTEDRGFMPHITLGKTRSDVPNKRLIDLLKNGHIPAGLSEKVERITLFRSELFPKGPVYHLLYSSALNTDA